MNCDSLSRAVYANLKMERLIQEILDSEHQVDHQLMRSEWFPLARTTNVASTCSEGQRSMTAFLYRSIAHQQLELLGSLGGLS